MADASQYSMELEAVVDSLSTMVIYKFRAQAHNLHGWGLRSEEFSTFTSGIPDKPDPVSVQIVNLDVMISWEIPNENYASVTRYLITIA